MHPIPLEYITERLKLADQLLAGRSAMINPQDLPGRYGGVVKAIDHILQAMNGESVLAGGWAVWRHGYIGRVTQGIDIVVPANQIDEFLRLAGVSGFEVLAIPPGRWPKVLHKETDIQVDLMPEGARPGTASRPAPTTIPHPGKMGAKPGALQYIDLASLVELKLAAGRARDEADLVELVRANTDQLEAMRQHVADVHADYARTFEQLIQRAQEQQDS